MRSVSPRARLAAAAIAAALLAGCSRPPDEAWLRFLGFQQNVVSGSSTSTVPVTVLKGKLLDGDTDTADAKLQNGSRGVGGNGSATGVYVDRVRVEYRMTGLAPPAFEYPVALYIPPVTTSGSTTAGGSATLSALPLAPAALKRWLIDTGAYANAALQPSADLQAHVTFYGETDEETRVETSGGISIQLLNAQ